MYVCIYQRKRDVDIDINYVWCSKSECIQLISHFLLKLKFNISLGAMTITEVHPQSIKVKKKKNTFEYCFAIQNLPGAFMFSQEFCELALIVPEFQMRKCET